MTWTPEKRAGKSKYKKTLTCRHKVEESARSQNCAGEKMTEKFYIPKWDIKSHDIQSL